MTQEISAVSSALEGRIIRGIGGFYYVETANGLYECKARGIFRKKGQAPLPGDMVSISVQSDGKEKEGSIEAIATRKNFLIRPAVANLDQLFIVSSVCHPDLNLFMIDKVIAVAENKGITPILLITKTDLKRPEGIADIYRKAGIDCFELSPEKTSSLSVIRGMLSNRLSAFTGNSGVGKSTLLNLLYPELKLQTGDISQKLGRGRHTTREVTLFPVEDGGYIADTPGFSSLDLERYEVVKKEDLPFCFREFGNYLDSCSFTSCSHTCEKGCAVLKAVAEGKIAPSRHANYVAMYNEVKNIKEWEKK